MRKIRIQNVQRAQGMVEFALVLPLLLLVILGVFAFGHLFFTYSSVVSASREAARWGAAVGTTGTGAGAMPRYQDCAAIRAAAVRVGNFAGVQASSVAIGYDNGPGTTQNANHCTGTAGPEVALGDRIVVTVTVHYRPIVPIVQMPTFDLNATSARTIIKNLAVGDAPTAVPLWPTTTTDITAVGLTPDADGKVHVVVGQTLTFKVTVIDSNNLSPTGGEVTVNDNTSASCSPATLTPDKNGQTCSIRYTTAGEREMSAQYAQLLSHYMPSGDKITVVVEKASTSVVVDSPAAWAGATPGTVTIVAGSSVPLRFHVTVNAPSEPTPTINFQASTSVQVNRDGTTVFNSFYTTPGTTMSYYLTPDVGMHDIVVYFSGDANFTASNSVTLKVLVLTPTAVPTASGTTEVVTVAPPTAVPSTVVSPTPRPTALPAYCPYSDGTLNFGTASSIVFDIHNADAKVGGTARTIDRIDVTWPTNLGASLNQVIWGDPISTCTTGTNCMLVGLNISPPHAILGGFAPSANSLDAKNNQNVTKTMRLVFSGALPTGPYDIIVHFAGGDNCQIEIAVDR